MIRGGLALALVSGTLALVLEIGIGWFVVLGSLITLGSGMALFGWGERSNRSRAATSPGADPALLAERSRRVHAVLERRGASTYEGLRAELRWADAALLPTLIHMRDVGSVVEDLDLDTGRWVLCSQVADDGGGRPRGSMTLADRQAQLLETGMGR